MLQPFSHFRDFNRQFVMVPKIMNQKTLGLKLLETLKVGSRNCRISVVKEVVRAGGNPSLFGAGTPQKENFAAASGRAQDFLGLERQPS